MIDVLRRFVLPAAYAVLPPVMRSREATAMLLAIGLQESRFMHRKQVVGPARGFWQFERTGGVVGVMTHPKTRGPLSVALTELRYADGADNAYELHRIIEHNDVVAAVFARLLLWTLPEPLPLNGEANRAWQQYLRAWNPGKPHPATWNNFFVESWARVEQGDRA